VPRFFHCACGDVFRSLDTRAALGQSVSDEMAKRVA
jgi:adenylate kinase